MLRLIPSSEPGTFDSTATVMSKGCPVLTKGDWLVSTMLGAGEATPGVAAIRTVDITTHVAPTDRTTALRARQKSEPRLQRCATSPRSLEQRLWSDTERSPSQSPGRLCRTAYDDVGGVLAPGEVERYLPGASGEGRNGFTCESVENLAVVSHEVEPDRVQRLRTHAGQAPEGGPERFFDRGDLFCGAWRVVASSPTQILVVDEVLVQVRDCIERPPQRRRSFTDLRDEGLEPVADFGLLHHTVEPLLERTACHQADRRDRPVLPNEQVRREIRGSPSGTECRRFGSSLYEHVAETLALDLLRSCGCCHPPDRRAAGCAGQ